MIKQGPELLTTPEAAEFLGGFHPVTLCTWRVAGKGPAYRKMGRRVFYTRGDLELFLAASRRTSTSDQGGG